MFNNDPYLRCVIILCLLVFLTVVQVVDGRGQSTAVISGVVVDGENRPVCDAVVEVLGPGWFRKTVLTDSSGRFRIVVNREGWYVIYGMCDRPETPGVDYVPAVWYTHLQFGATSSFKFVLVEGASIHLEGDIWFVESSKPANYYRFTVKGYEIPLVEGSSVVTYGSDVDLVSRFGLDDRLVIVPADTKVKVEVDARVNGLSHRFFLEGKTGFFKLSQGESLHFDVRECNILFNFENLKGLWDSAFSILEDSEDAGFLVNVERADLIAAYKLMKEAVFLLKTESYDESFAKLRNAYILTAKSTENLQGLLRISSQSVLQLLFLFVFIASASAHLVTEERINLEVFAGRRSFSLPITPLITVAFYGVLIASFYALFPGCHLVSRETFTVTSIFALIIGQAAVTFLPRVFSERRSEQRSIQLKSAVIAAFSIACRNLRRRRMRTIMSVTNIAILVFGFITLTSISPGYGLVIQPLRPSHAVDALLVRDEPLGSDNPFTPLPQSFLRWIESQPNITLVSPKAENTPISLAGEPLGYLYSRSGSFISVYGVLGVVPSAEANLTLLNNTVVKGRFLEDGDIHGILISSSLEERLEADVGDKLYGFEQEFIIRGFFDPKTLQSWKDIDGKPIVPYCIVPMAGPAPCSGDNVIILTYDRALTLPKVTLSRVNIQLENPEEYSPLSKIIALTREYKTYISHPGTLHAQSVGSYLEEKGVGMTFFLMFLVVLNIAVEMLGSVKERREEIASLSSVGLNPTHIAALFIAEGVIIGFVGGGLGYLLGIFGYRIASTPFFGALQVREKVSAEWGLTALLISGFTAIVSSLIPAIQASTIVTPSLLRRWKLRESERPGEQGKPWVIDMPIRLMPKEVEPFTGFILKRMRESLGEVTDTKLVEEASAKGQLKRISFKYSVGSEGTGRSENELVIHRGEDINLDVRLFCTPSNQLEDTVHKTATYVRKLIFEWNAMEFEVAAPFDPSLSQLYTLVNAYSPTTLYILTTKPEIERKLDTFRKALVTRGLRPPRIVISRVKPLNIEQTMKAAEEVVSRADVVCISGEPAALSSALAVNAEKQKKIKCYVVDSRPKKERIKNPFKPLKIVNVT